MKDNNNKKRILHVLHIVYDILSALFIIFVSSALIINAVSRGDKQKQDILTPNVQEVKHKQNAIIGTDRSISMSNELVSDDFLLTIVSASNLVYGYNINNQNNTSVLYIGEGYYGGVPTYPRVTIWNNVNYSSMTCGGVEGTNWWYLDNIYMVINSKGEGAGVHYYNITFYFRDDLESDLFHVTCNLFTTNINNLLDTTSFSLANNMYVLDEPGMNWNFAVIYSNGNSLDTMLNSMSNDNYQEGYRLGYEAGYQSGYVSGSTGLDNNVFRVIGQAFSSVANIFSIELIPGFPLWILVFTPLIIAVVIVVVKMIKG